MDTRGRVCSPDSLATQTPDQAPPAAPLECNVLYKYRAKIRAVHLPIAEWERGTVDTVMTVTDFWQADCLFPIAWTSNDSFARPVAMPNSA